MKTLDYYDRRIGPGCPPLMITPEEACEMTGLNYKTMLRLCREGVFPVVKSGIRYKINRIKLMEFLDGSGPDQAPDFSGEEAAE